MNDQTMVFCKRFHKDMPALTAAPLVGAIGELIKSSCSAEAWNEWVEAQMKIVNEERLDLSEARAQAHLYKKMLDFLGISEQVAL
jgi:Fe-S cluster biosynthesis and repair protein YggX